MAPPGKPLGREAFSDAAWKAVAPGAPKPIRLMAARGLVPGLSGPELACVLYQLTFDEDEAIASQARSTLAELDERILSACVSEPLPGPVLHALAEPALASTKLLEKLLQNQNLPDQAVLELVPNLSERLCELVARNEQRLLRCPAIIEALYQNPNTRMSTASRCVELAVRNGIELQIPAFKEMVQALGLGPKEEDPVDRALAEAERDQAFAKAYAETAGEELPEEGEEGQEEERKLSLVALHNLTVPEKVRLAILGNAFQRSVLLRDANRLVAMAAIKSPRITELEVVRVAKSPQVSEDVLRYIATHREWAKLYQVKANLVTNPKTPLAVSLRLLPHLRARELKLLSRSKNVPAALRNAAKERLAKKKPG